MKYPHLAIAIAALAIVGTACAGPANPTSTPVQAASTSSPTPTSTPTGLPTPTAALATSTPTVTSPTGQMSHARSTHTATTLLDGRVLLAGGYYNSYPITLADLYNPTSDTFTATGEMATARGFDSGTRLDDGRVLFVGGDPAAWNYTGHYLASAELYQPTTGTFGPTGSLVTARNLHTATLLLDGRVLITGGSDTFGHAVASAELYDPTTGTFTATGSMGAARGFHTATVLLDGRVLIAGGTHEGWGSGFLASAEIYDPTTGTFTPTASMADMRSTHTATLLADGRVLITGGYPDHNNGGVSLASAEVYDPKSDTFTPTGSMADSRTFHGATLLADGRVLVTGGVHTGWDYIAPFLASAEIYDPTTGMFSSTGSMTDQRVSHTATLLPDDHVLIAGGFNGTADVATAELYDPVSGTFRLVGSGS